MAVIVKSAWKNKKAGDEVEYKGEVYTIGSDAFGSVEAAVAAENAIGAIDNARSATFKAAADAEVDFNVGAIWSAEEVDTKVSVEKCQIAADLQDFMMNKGDVIKLNSAGKFGDGTWAMIELDGLTADTLDVYFDGIEGASFTGKGTLVAAITEDEFKLATDGKVGIGKDISFQSLLA